MREMVTLDDFGTGILAGFVANGVDSVHVRNLDEALVRAYQYLENQEANLRFHISLNEFYRDAPQAREAIGDAVSRGLGNFDDLGRLHIDITSNYLNLYFESLPLDEETWKAAAAVAITHLREN